MSPKYISHIYPRIFRIYSEHHPEDILCCLGSVQKKLREMTNLALVLFHLLNRVIYRVKNATRQKFADGFRRGAKRRRCSCRSAIYTTRPSACARDGTDMRPRRVVHLILKRLARRFVRARPSPAVPGRVAVRSAHVTAYGGRGPRAAAAEESGAPSSLAINGAAT